MLNEHLAFLGLALEEAKKAEMINEVPIGAIIVKNGEIISVGHNEKETTHNMCGHAEVLAMQRAGKFLNSWRLTDCTLYVTLEPCLMCLAVAQQARVSKIVFGATDKKAGALSLGYLFHTDRRTNHRFLCEYVPYPPAGAILSEFFKKLRQN